MDPRREAPGARNVGREAGRLLFVVPEVPGEDGGEGLQEESDAFVVREGSVARWLLD